MERFRTMFQGFTYMDLGQFKKRLRSMAALGGAGSLCFYCIGLWAGDERFYKSMVMPLVRRVDPERAHVAAVWLARHRLTPSYTQPDPDILRTSLWGLHFANPIGLAAGFDKHGEACDGMLRLGFGFVEVGSVTPLPQSGNRRPRVFRLVEDNAIINRYGFNSDGHEAVGERLRKRLQESGSTSPSAACSAQAPSTPTPPPPVGVNLGKNKLTADAASDYVAGVKTLADVAGYLVVNVSSPNTPGLRDMQHGESLEQLLDRVLEARDALPEDKLRQRPPLLLKIAPDLTHAQKQHVAQCALKRKSRLAGLVVGNTTVSRPPSLLSRHRSETGGLSGRPLKQLATSTVAEMYRLTNGEVPIVGVGGVASGQDAYDKIRAGASLVQLYTALTVDGPPTVSAIKRQLAELLRRDGFSNVSEAVGADHRSASAE